MIKQLFIKLIKTISMATPFLSMLIMILALWGVGGKATYIDLNPAKQQEKFVMGEAKNILVNETKQNQLCPSPMEKSEMDKMKEKIENDGKLPENIDWEHVI